MYTRVVSKSDSDHESGYYGRRSLGLMYAGTICHSTRSLGHYHVLKAHVMARMGQSDHYICSVLHWLGENQNQCNGHMGTDFTK